MAIRTHQSVYGFVASDPQLTHTERGDARLYLKLGIEHYRREDDNSYTQLETTFHDLIAFRGAAEQGAERLAKGDNIIAATSGNTPTNETASCARARSSSPPGSAMTWRALATRWTAVSGPGPRATPPPLSPSSGASHRPPPPWECEAASDERRSAPPSTRRRTTR